MSKFTNILLKFFAALASVFSVTFVVYFFNLDMKLLSAIEPFFLNHYDKMPRNQQL